MPGPSAIWLLNCRRCDDIFRVTERMRSCECAHASGQLDALEVPQVEGLQARLLSIEWEDYDGVIEGESRQWKVAREPLPAGADNE